MKPRLFLLQCVLCTSLLAIPQQEHHWTERENLGFKGPVRSVATTVHSLNPDPRPASARKLDYRQNPDWVVFDLTGKRIEMASFSDPNGVREISKLTIKPDGTEVWTDSRGQSTESSRKETILADGRHEITSYTGTKVIMREVKQFDDQGRTISSVTYLEDNHLVSEESIEFDSDGETTTTRLFDPRTGKQTMHQKLHVPNDKSRFDRWSYAADGTLVWHIAVNDHGELLSSWYLPGYLPEVSSSDALGICRPKLCVSYMFDRRGRMEKVVEHTPAFGNVEPDSKAHYNFAGQVDEKVEMKYRRDAAGNWYERSVFVWDALSNEMVDVERDTRKIEYY